MSLTTDLEIRNIKEYADLLEKIYHIQINLDYLRDRLSNLASYMSQEDINEANKLLKKRLENDPFWLD